MADKDKLASVENSLVQKYNERGFLLEDEVIDCCVDHDLDLAEIDAVCDRLLKRNIIFRESETNNVVVGTEDEVYDRSQLDYNIILNRIKKEYPSCEYLVEQIQNILPPQHKEWRTLIKEAQAGNSFARDRIIQMYLRTMLKQAYDFSKAYHCDFEDCFQNATIGLMLAIEKYDVTSPDSFVSYFPLWARQNMNRDCVIEGTLFRFPAHYKDQFMPLINGLNDTEIGFDAVASTDIEIIKQCEDNDNISGMYYEIEKTFHFLFHNEYIELTGGKIDYNYIIPYLPLYDVFTIEDDFTEKLIEKEEALLLRKNIETALKSNEKDVIMLRYGLEDGVQRTLEEVGAKFGVTRERIRQIESKAMKKLKRRYKVLF